jgi:group I intron endonuclease
MSEAKSGENHSNFGKFLSEGIKVKMSQAKTGKNHPLYGRTHTPETKAKQSLAMLSENHPMFGQIHSTETKAKISITRGTVIYVYSFDKSILINTFISAREAAKYFETYHYVILNHAKKV